MVWLRARICSLFKVNRKSIVVLILFLICTKILFGQTSFIKETRQGNYNKDSCISQFDSISNRSVYTIVNEMPMYWGGNDSLNEFIVKNLRWPSLEIDCFGTVYVSFIVEIDGKLTNIRILRGLCTPFDEEALRVIKLIPEWEAGKCNGIAVPVKFCIPIRFYLN